MKRIYLLTTLCCLTFILKAQNWSWVKTGTGAAANARSVTVDNSGNVYIAGNFSSQLNFNGQILSSGGQTDGYIVKYNQAGDVQWVRRVGGSWIDYISSITTDANGNLYITGYHSSASLTLENLSLSGYNGFFNMFVAKYDANGTALWVRSSNITTCDTYSNAVATDADGNVFVTGYFTTHTITFGSTTLTNGSAGPAGSNPNMFFLKYDTGGNLLWAKQAVSSNYTKGNSICVDASGNAYVTGTFRDLSVSFDAVTLTNSGKYDYFLVKYSSNGNVLWARRAGNSQDEIGNDVALDENGNVYTTGYFASGTVSFDGTTLTNTYPYPYKANMFLAKYNPAGSLQWVKRAGGSSGYGDMGYALASYGKGVYVSGRLGANSMTMGAQTLTPSGPSADPTFLANYKADGSVVYATHLQGGAMITNDICSDRISSLYLVADYRSSINPFNIGSTSLTPSAIDNLFVAKMTSAFTLPVRLTDFTIKALNNQLQLQWNTQEESGIDGYQVQRSSSSTGGFIDLAYVASVTNRPSNIYTYTDRSVKPNSRYYYRLAIIEGGSIKSYSSVKSCALSNQNANLFWVTNPAKQTLDVNVEEDGTELTLFNNNGQLLSKKVLNTAGKASWDVRSYAPGTYWIRARCGEKNQTVQVLFTR